MPLLTTVLAFLVGGLVVLATGHNPLAHVQGDLQRHRAELVLRVRALHIGTGHDTGLLLVEHDTRSRACNLQQTLIAHDAR